MQIKGQKADTSITLFWHELLSFWFRVRYLQSMRMFGFLSWGTILILLDDFRKREAGRNKGRKREEERRRVIFIICLSFDDSRNAWLSRNEGGPRLFTCMYNVQAAWTKNDEAHPYEATKTRIKSRLQTKGEEG